MAYVNVLTPSLPFSDTVGGTSYDAAVHAHQFAGSQRERLLAWFQQRGARGSTDRETEVGLGMSRSSVCARRNELIALGLVVKDEGHRRAGAFAGVRQQVWVAVTESMEG